MTDLSWLANEARAIHQYFQQIFFVLVGFFLVLGVVIEYFKLPLGVVPSFGTIAGRVLIATVLLVTFPEVIDALSALSDALSRKLGDPNQFNLVRAKMAEKLSEFSWSWVKIKESIIVVLCYVCFVLFHFSIYVSDAFFLYAWTLLYIFSPVLIALFVMPATASATRALYQSLIEVACWKPVWMVSATILWSAALSDLNKPATQVSFLSVICYCLVLAGSLLTTPIVVHALTRTGLAMVAGAGSIIMQKQVIKTVQGVARNVYSTGATGSSVVVKKYFPKAYESVRNKWHLNAPKKKSFKKPKKPKDNK